MSSKKAIPAATCILVKKDRVTENECLSVHTSRRALKSPCKASMMSSRCRPQLFQTLASRSTCYNCTTFFWLPIVCQADYGWQWINFGTKTRGHPKHICSTMRHRCLLHSEDINSDCISLTNKNPDQDTSENASTQWLKTPIQSKSCSIRHVYPEPKHICSIIKA